MSEQHSIAVSKWSTDNAWASQESISAYAPVAKSLLFDRCYILGKEMMAFKKYPALMWQ